ncbi:MAG: hypothetical protein ACXU9D_25720, partial [Xanthobacteraceae bacterium]
MSSENLQFKVVRTNGSDEVIARTSDLLVGRAAFERAAALHPNDLIEFRRPCDSPKQAARKRITLHRSAG